MAAVKLELKTRTELGKNKVNKLRKADMVPGVIYSKGEETRSIKVDRGNLQRVYKIAGTSSIIDLELEGETIPAIIKELQLDPVKDEYVHVDFQKIKMDEVVKLTIPVVLEGKDNIRLQPSVLMQQLDEIEIECLPKYIPEAAVADVSNIDFNTPIYVSDLDIFKNENITIFKEPDELVATLMAPAKTEEEEEETEEVQAGDVPVVGKDEEE
ncbi:MAG: 50S ribosomal protein L25 [Tissierellia bacterium]|nr:50S ribosomal protein L25 [Tissierellia bacterium]